MSLLKACNRLNRNHFSEFKLNQYLTKTAVIRRHSEYKLLFIIYFRQISLKWFRYQFVSRKTHPRLSAVV
ncbi:hypothetical protein SHAM105786_16395 [Shewanella amazonensis]